MKRLKSTKKKCSFDAGGYIFAQRQFLDLACAGGIFANAFKKDFPSFQIKGIDLDTKLIAKAKENYPGLESSFSCDDYEKLSNEKFDVIHASGILSVFENFEEALTQWIDLLSENGKFFLFNRFNSKDIDVLIRHRNNTKNYGWETGLNTFSINTLKRYLNSRTSLIKSKKFALPFDSGSTKDPIRSFTKTLKDQSRIVVNGANIITEHFFVIIEKMK